MGTLLHGTETTRGDDRTSTGARFDWLLSVLSIWWVVGLYLDGRGHLAGGHWAFFTPEHLFLYSTFPLFGIAVFSLVASNRSDQRGTTWDLPRDYRYSIVGTVLFGLGGVVDLFWHQTSISSQSAWVLFTPPHLLLVVSGVLIASGPLRTRWRSPGADTDTPWTHAPVLLCASAVLSVASFVTVLANPFVDPLAAASDSSHLGTSVPSILPSFHLTQELGVLSILLQTVILVVVVLVLVRGFSLPAGSFALLFGVHAALLSLLSNQLQFLPVIVAAGVTADGLYVWSRNRVSPNGIRLLAFVVPIVLFSLYFVQLSFVDAITWGAVTWLGTIVLAGGVGFCVSYFVLPPGSSGVADEAPPDPGKFGTSAASKANVETFSSSKAIDEYTDRATEGLYPQERKAIERHFDGAGGRVLDLGCGTGRAARPLVEMGYDVVGVDPSEAMVTKATAIHPDIDFVVGDGTDLLFRDASFDYVLFTYFGLDYVHPEENRIRALREIQRVLKPGGVFVFSSHNWWNVLPSTIFEGASALEPIVGRENALDPSDRYTSIEVPVGETLVYLSSPARQRRQLERCGFDVIDVVGKRDSVLRYVEVAPHYVARKPLDHP